MGHYFIFVLFEVLMAKSSDH